MLFYHVALKRHLNSISKYGLLVRHRKNVRISISHTNYVFASKLEAGYFASEMQWKLEESVIILTIRLNKKDVFQDMNTRAMIGSWFYTYKNIKPEQIVKIEEFDDKFIKAHKKRMDKAVGKTQEMVVRMLP